MRQNVRDGSGWPESSTGMGGVYCAITARSKTPIWNRPAICSRKRPISFWKRASLLSASWIADVLYVAGAPFELRGRHDQIDDERG